MRRLILLRHAKAVPHGVVPDFDRSLTDQGREDARRMGAYLAQENLFPDLAAISSAKRTRETYDLVSQDWAHRPPVRQEPRIYEATASMLLSLMRQTPDHVTTLISVGHNPGFAELAVQLVGYGDRYAFARMTQKFPISTSRAGAMSSRNPDGSTGSSRPPPSAARTNRKPAT